MSVLIIMLQYLWREHFVQKPAKRYHSFCIGIPKAQMDDLWDNIQRVQRCL